MKEKRTITMSELLQMNVSTMEIKDNSSRGMKTVPTSEIKPGDEVLLNNYFHLVVGENKGKKMSIYEVQLGIISGGAKNGDLDYNSPQIILIESDHYPNIEEVEKILEKEIKSFGCDCVYGITPCEDWELKEYECYKTTSKFTI